MKSKTYEELVQENTALAAHVEAAGPHITAYCNFESSPHEFAVAMVEWERSSPETSLARLKAEWQAEAMEGWLEQMRYMEGLNTFDCMESAELYAEELRRQAEEAP